MKARHQPTLLQYGLLLILTVLHIGWSPEILAARSANPLQDTSVSSVKRKLVVLPAQATDDDPFSIDREVTRTIAGLAAQIGRFEVVDRNDLTAILQEQDLHLYGLVDDSVAISVGKIAAANEALLVTVENFSQHGVPPDDNSDYTGTAGQALLLETAKWIRDLITLKAVGSIDPGTEQYPGNIETQISIDVRNIDIDTGRILHAFRIDASHTGGSTGNSRSEAMRILRQQAAIELRRLHRLYTMVLLDEPGSLILVLGDDVGIKYGMLFEIRTAGTEKLVGKRYISLPGRAVAYAQVQDYGKESCRAVPIRQWAPVHDGYEAVERVRGLTAGSFDFTGSPTQTPILLGLGGMYRGYGLWDFGLGMRYMQATDSHGTTTHGLTLNGCGCLRLLPRSRLSLVASIGLMAALPFRRDDANRVVGTEILTPYVDATVELLATQNFDILAGIGYRFTSRSGDWTGSKDPSGKNTPAIWYGEAPTVDISGPYATIGIKFMMAPLINPGISVSR